MGRCFHWVLTTWVVGGGALAKVSPVVSSLVSQMTVREKARQLDIFKAADAMTNGHVNMTKAAAKWGDLSLGVGTLHDVYPPSAAV